MCWTDTTRVRKEVPASRRSLVPSDPYYRHWQLLTQVTRWSLIGLVLSIAGSFIALIWFPWPEDERWVFLVVSVVVGVSALPLFARAGMPCPRCDKPYFQKLDEHGAKTWRSNTFTRHCLNCGLPMWSPGEPSRLTGTLTE